MAMTVAIAIVSALLLFFGRYSALIVPQCLCCDEVERLLENTSLKNKGA
jgi:hypothetical protein